MARTPHFEAYSQADDATVAETLRWFERLRQFFLQQTGLNGERMPPMRVIGFRSTEEYKLIQLRPNSDAYYVGTPNRDYIVMPALGATEFRIAAHEYTHAVVHALGVRLPPWLNEGMAEVFSTVRIDDRSSTFGGALPAHIQFLKRHGWMPLSELWSLTADSATRDNRDSASLFYAQSWAVTGMLLLSPDYAPKFQQLVAVLNAGSPVADAVERVYSKRVEDVEKDVAAWLASGSTRTKTASMAAPGAISTQVSDVPAVTSQAVLADLLLAGGQLERAEAMYGQLAREAPQSGDFPAALALIAVRRGDVRRAQEYWKKAMAGGVRDATLCYEYAIRLGAAGVPETEARGALERAVALNADFDDARYQLALLELNAGQFEETIAQLRAMKLIAPKRAFQYWSTLSYALEAAGQNDESKQAADRAKQCATTPGEKAHAERLAYTADTELAVQFTRDSNGGMQAVTTRVPRGRVNHNPFIEPGDLMRQTRGELKAIECQGQITGIVVDAPEGTLRLSIPDPLHVQILNGPSEFQCGEQSPLPVVVSYASASERDNSRGVVRGIEFQ
ncbi:MAG: hypothetical protein WBW33_37675 [Bryobacteraceae bacterium]